MSADRAFAQLCRAAGLVVLGVLAAIAAFLVYGGLPAFSAGTTGFLTTARWTPDAHPSVFGIAAVAVGTLETSVIAVLVAAPIAVGVALFITDYAPRRLATGLGWLTDLLAAVPSVVIGLWGLYFLVPHLTGLQDFLARYFGWIPVFAVPGSRTASTGTLFIAGLVLAIMILPIIAAVAREVFAQADPAHKHAALALGATRAEMLRIAVLPPSRGGLVAAAMLGLGRALGETIAIALVLGTNYQVTYHLLRPGGNTIAANIALQFGEAGKIGIPALIASGLVLFGITLAVNLAARAVIARSGTSERSSLA